MTQEELYGFILCYDMPRAGGPLLESLKQPQPPHPPTLVYMPLSPTYQVSIDSQPRTLERNWATRPSKRSSSAANFSEAQIPSPPLQFQNSNQASTASTPPLATTAAGTEEGRSKPSRLPRTARKGTPDLEKATYDHGSMRSGPSSDMHSHHSTIVYEEEDEEEENNANDPNKHAVWILVCSLVSPSYF